jgi:CheY-like chemotaxis protein
MERSPMRTLVVEDDITNQILLQSFLSKYGQCEVKPIDTGKLLRHIQDFHFV